MLLETKESNLKIFLGQKLSSLVRCIYIKSKYVSIGDAREEILGASNTKVGKERPNKYPSQNLRVLMMEVYKALNHTNPPFMQEYCIKKDSKYDPRTRVLPKIPAS